MSAIRSWWGRYARHEPRTLLRTGLTILVLLCVAYLGWVRTRTGQMVDIDLFSRAQSVDAALAPPAALLRRGLPPVGAVAVVLLGLAAVRRGAWRETAAAGLVVVTSVALSSLLKATLERPYLGDLGYVQNTFPSGHVTATAALAVAVVLLWPRPRPRSVPLTAVAVCAIASLASVIGYAHRPSDTIGSLLLVLLVTTAAVGVFPDRRPVPVERSEV
ncbi:phosphatase PAP2 family protein [Pengzhenrongella frigida]|uniref:Phosphatase PAP2 family protein n=1 Tax=Pengzhenrongella frigida TaxID=1259133 RepID=A0A4Q5N3Y9_9MICO|nr:phosphatase PAP2 family protein [Cellulomonas sp. HLT2-17]RYV50741.1 phosphatase PAP2 family protein [Cellulomonas sp. HLT2-17]